MSQTAAIKSPFDESISFYFASNLFISIKILLIVDTSLLKDDRYFHNFMKMPQFVPPIVK